MYVVGFQYLLEVGDYFYFCGELEQVYFYVKVFLLELLINELVMFVGKQLGSYWESYVDLLVLENGVIIGVNQLIKIVQVYM